MLFSIVSPTYNRLSFLKEALESVWRQTFTDYEVIIVDDGSTDSTVKYLRSLGSRVKVMTQAHQGPGAARNFGMKQAQGKYIAFLDSDDLWFPWSLETYALIIRETDSPAFIAGNPFRFRDEVELSRAAREPLALNMFPDYLASGDEWRWWGVSSFVVRTDVIRERGGFASKNMNGEDGDLALRLGDARGFVQITVPITFAYRQHDTNATADLAKTVEGVLHKIRTEIANGYPGGRRRMTERLQILTRHARPVALECLRAGWRREGWQIYRATFRWHWILGRWKFITGFPLRAFFSRR